MTDWLEIARRELSPHQGEVSELLSVGGSRDPRKSGSSETLDGASHAAREHDLKGEPPTTEGATEKRVSAVFTADRTRNPEKSGSLVMSASRSVADDPVWEDRDLENPSILEEATAKTAERGVSDVFAVGQLEGGAGNEAITSAGTLPSGTVPHNPLDEALRKPSEPTSEEGCPKNEKALDGELRKPSKLLLESERLSSDDDAVARWRRLLEDKTIVVQRVRDLPRAEAEREAYRIIISEYLNETHPNSDSRACAWCNKPSLPLTPTLPFGVGERHVWLHQHCHQAWSVRRRTEVVASLAGLGIVEPEAADEA
jgi:hypothetical protein